MATNTKTSTIPTPPTIEFEPYCEWRKEQEPATLVFRLPGFKKDQLRVQVNINGVLKVSGEMQVTEGGKTKTKKFLKESKIPDGCDINDIQAKFSKNELHVIMPKKITPEIAQEKKLAKDNHIFGLGNSLKRLQAQKTVSLSIGVAVAVIVAIGAYAAYSYGSCPSSSSQIEE
ncbi:unnamed protein product [Amaranthus hypochondriacus]